MLPLTLEERGGSPTFPPLLLVHAILSAPGGVAPVCPFVTCAMVPSGFSIPSATSQIRNNGAQSLQPDGLRPAPSLSTLSPRRYRRRPKTRYGMCWVGTFPVALAATSS